MNVPTLLHIQYYTRNGKLFPFFGVYVKLTLDPKGFPTTLECSTTLIQAD